MIGGGVVEALVFSKDRPAQLDLLLRTLRIHAGSFYSSVRVLWTASAPEYADGYLVCMDEHEVVEFERERDFELDLRRFLGEAGPLVSFLVDDDVFYRDAPCGELALPLSLRDGDFDYPFSVDGNVYERQHVALLLRDLHFDDPTELESLGHLYRARLPFERVNPAPKPCLVGVPWNRVSDRSRMPFLGVHEYDLNERYLAGGRLEGFTADWLRRNRRDSGGPHANIAPLWRSAAAA